ncbi:hypothetical protein N7457_001808 [Penicillium paradoxum]|uniref:uncharacterized protein n=1 Tax=Penicillium paradoxum TaxID=176176 RepID=UPI002546F589|nr:uncharacterized protein N7457_001808 [Penicillium paradoxum]KAJ5795209.1 hypothetical protein N7457_001808 [Penicillium paradoxum]
MGKNEDIKNDNPPAHNRDCPDHESNPFVAFRRFADEQVSTMLQSITGLPSMVAPPHSGHWDIFASDHGYESRLASQRTSEGSDRDRSYPSDRDSGSGYPGGDDPRNYGKSSRSRWSENDDPWHSQSWRKWCNGPSDFFGLDSFFDRFWLEDRFFPFAAHLLHPGHTLFLPDLFEDTGSPTWPIAYIMFSPYSPLHLERQAKYWAHRERGVLSSVMSSLHLSSDPDSSEPRWREAFEDLLRLENGKPMLDRDTTTKSEPGKNWLQGLVKRGSLGDQWKYVPGTEGQPWSGITFSGHADSDQDRSRSVPKKENDSPDSELELYERFLQDIENREREFFRGASESPLLRLLLEERRQQQEELEKYRSSVPKLVDEHSSDDNENWIDLVSGGNKKSVPETPMALLEETETKSVEAVSELAPPRVVSTMTRTERVQLADGSVQTKVVNTKRFADGREESDESVEVSHPREGSKPNSDGSKNGWFWKD